MGDAYEVVCIGRVGVDIYPTQIGVPLEDVTTFGKFLGGSATNVSVAAARYGHRSAIITKTGNDPFGRFVRSKLADLGVATDFVGTDPWLPTPVDVLRDLPARRLPALLLPLPAGTRPADRGDRSSSGRDRRCRRVLGDADRVVRRAQPAEPPRRVARPRTPALHDPRPRLPPDVLEERVGGDAERRSRPGPQHGGDRQPRGVPGGGGGGRPRTSGPGPSGTRNRAGDREAGPQGRPGHDRGRTHRSASGLRGGGQRARRR